MIQGRNNVAAYEAAEGGAMGEDEEWDSDEDVEFGDEDWSW